MSPSLDEESLHFATVDGFEADQRHISSSIVNENQDERPQDPMEVDTSSWKGWAELENDPIIFTNILRSWGVEDVQVKEVIPLDTILEQDPSAVLGLIFLSRWAAPESVNEPRDSPDGLWFANQISTFSCATLAMMNIINNRNNIILGRELQDFRTSTLTMTAKERGIKLDSFQFVKDIHNSFSRELDRMHVDLRVKEDAQAAARKSRKSRKAFTKRKKRRAIDEEDENGFHFVAYVPAHAHVWRLDGLEAHPRDMGSIEDGDSWLMKTIADLQVILETSETDGTEFSLLSLVNEKAGDVSSLDETNTARLKEDWSPFVAHMLRLHAEKGDIDELLGRDG